MGEEWLYKTVTANSELKKSNSIKSKEKQHKRTTKDRNIASITPTTKSQVINQKAGTLLAPNCGKA